VEVRVKPKGELVVYVEGVAETEGREQGRLRERVLRDASGQVTSAIDNFGY
jgi:hypothetical protein